MKYCSNCLQPDTRPNTFFQNNICPACQYNTETQNINWEARFEILREIANKISQVNEHRNNYDCIIGVSGGKDSTRQALFVRDKLKLNPLLVCLSYPPNQVTERGVNNISNLISLGFDLEVVSPAAQTWQKLKKKSFDIFVNSFRSTELALFASVPQVAIRKNISTIFWGENPALQVGDMKALGRTGYDGNYVRKANTLSSGHDWMLEKGFQINKILNYIYPSKKEFEKNKLNIIYLGWFLGNWSEIENAKFSLAQGLEMRKDFVEKTADLYGVTALDEDFTPINQFIKYTKFGFGRVTDYVNEDIRNGRMTREQGIKIIEKYDSSIDKIYLKIYCDYLGITVSEFWKKIFKNTNKEIFKIKNKKIVPKFKVGQGLK